MTIIASDTFARANQSGWGTASDTEVWSHPIGSNPLNISSNEGTISGGFSRDIMILGSATTTDCDGKIGVTKTSSDGIWIVLRATDGNNHYAMSHSNDNSGNLQIDKVVGGSNTTLAQTSFSFTDGTPQWLRGQIIGTTLKVKMWAQSGSEPGAWNLTVTDATYASGKYGLGAALRSNATTVQFDHFTVDNTLISTGENAHMQTKRIGHILP